MEKGDLIWIGFEVVGLGVGNVFFEEIFELRL